MPTRMACFLFQATLSPRTTTGERERGCARVSLGGGLRGGVAQSHRAPGQHGEEEDDEDKPANPKKNGKKGGGRGRGAGGAGDKQGQ